MRHIERFPCPQILEKKREEWQRKYEEKLQGCPKARPDGSKYGHKEILDTLWRMSLGKCFYCEGRLKGGISKEVDHHVEVAIAPALAYDWNNLYYSCGSCNHKLNHQVIPITDALDPCVDSNDEIRAHLSFEDELVCPANHSEKGRKTIQKYKLDDELLDYRRLKVLKKLIEKVNKIRKQMIEEQRSQMTDSEKESVLRFMQSDQPYSLMCEVYIEQSYNELLQ